LGALLMLLVLLDVFLTVLYARGHGHHQVKTLAAALAYRAEEIDPAGSRPQSVDERQEFSARLHSVG
jgi:hypothetical protein